MEAAEGGARPRNADVGAWSRARRAAFLTLVGLLVAGGPLGTDMYIPAMPDVAADLAVPVALVQLTLPAYNVGLGAGQFLWGPASDRFGRRGPLLVGIAAFILGCLLCMVAPSIWVLLAARLVMGVGGSAGVVIGRAIARDLYTGSALARVFGVLAVIFGIAPVVAPLIGGVALLVADWRGTFAVMGAIGLVLLLGTALCIPETLRAELRVRGRSTARREAWVAPLRNRAFVAATLTLVGAGSSMILYLTSVSIILQDEHGLDSSAVAVLYAVNAVGVVLAGQFGPLLARLIGGLRTLALALTLNLAAASLVATASALAAPLWLVVTGMWVTVAATGVCFPVALALALAPFARGAGTAAAIACGCQLALGSVIPAVVAGMFGPSGVVLGVAQAVTTLLTIGLVAGTALARQIGRAHV